MSCSVSFRFVLRRRGAPRSKIASATDPYEYLLGCVCYPAMQKGQWAATTEFKINLTAPVSKGTVTGNAEILNMTRTQAVVRIDLENEGRVCAMAQGTCTIRDPR